MLNAVAFDYETHLIGPTPCQCGLVHDQLPPAVCMSWALPDGRSDVVTPAAGLAVLDECLADSSCQIVGAETSFDVLVSCVNSNDFDTWIARWVAAYREGRVHDVCIRQKLLDLAAGSYRWLTFSDGRRLRIGYDLATVSKRQTGRLLVKPTKETESTHWRLRYALLDGVPICDWPSEAVEYAREDSLATIEDWLAQQAWRDTKAGDVIEDLWQGFAVAPSNDSPDPFADVIRQTQHALWLKAMSAEGLRTDAKALDRFEKHVRREYVQLCAEVRGHGLARREYWRDLTAMRAQGNRYRANKEWAVLKAELDADLPEAEAAWHELHDAGLVRSRHVKNMKAARSRMFDVCMAKHKPIPRTDKYDDECSPIDSCIAIDSDACRLSQDNALQAYAELTHVGKMLTTDIKQLRMGVDRPIHTHYEVCLETGRTSSAGPNVQNRARGEAKTVVLRDGSTREGRPGDRECFVPREGNVLVDCDYPQLELYCLAQVCRWALGYSTLGDALLAGKDPHTDFAALIVAAGDQAKRLPYDVAKLAIKDKEHPLFGQLKKARDAAKGVNFGRPGGLGAETMVSYAAKSYGVVKSREDWETLLKLWDLQWPEMPDYFAFINGLETYPRSGSFCVPQMWSGRLRAGATYCAACNSFYQGLGADVAKLAGWYVFQACYVRGFDDALFGCTPVNFIHDQLMVEAPEAQAQLAAERVEYWCRQAAIEVLPDYGQMMASKTEAILCRRWSKNAEAVRDEQGGLGVWEDERLMIDDFEEGADDVDAESAAA